MSEHAQDLRLPDVSVVMITYNHEAYIEEAINSVFMQEYPGRLRLIVGDDASTDATPEKLRALAERAPIEFDLILRPKNIGGLANLKDVWSRATGSYIALLEGDDYWTRPDKLARQVLGLEARPSATLAFSRADTLDESTSPPRIHAPMIKALVDPQSEDLLEQNLVPTCTAVYRRGVMPSFPDWLEECPIRDWPLHAIHAAEGDIFYMNEVQAVYRLHSHGRWTAMDFGRRLRVVAEIRERMWRELGEPASYVPSRLRARTLASMAAGAETRKASAGLLLSALRQDRSVALYWPFLYTAARILLGDTAARAGLRAAYKARGLPPGLMP